MSEFEVGANLKHQQDEADLADDGDGRRCLCAEQKLRRAREKMSEQRWSENKARHNLADNAGLAETAQDLIAGARRGNHHDQLQKRVEKQAFRLMDR
jgi:hypothetical protein